MLSRRVFLASSSAVAVAHMFHSFPVAAEAPAVVRPATTIWVGGHNGEFDWRAISADTREQALRELFNAWEGTPDFEVTDAMLAEHDLCLERVSSMDGLQLEEIKAYDWVNAGFGACCDRCGSECFAPDGARALNGEAICEECLTIPDLLDGDDWDRNLAEERLTEWFLGHDCDEGSVRVQMASSFDPDLIPSDIWQKCLAEARANL